MMRHVLVATALVCSSLVIRVDASNDSVKPYQIRIVKILCADQPYERTVLHYCKTVLRRNKPTLLNISITFPEIINELYMSVDVAYKFTEYRPFLFNATAEVCEFLRNPPHDPLSVYLLDLFSQSLPTVVHPCPHGNFTYTVEWTMDERLTPATLPAGDYRVTVIWRDVDQALLLNIQIFGSVRRKGIFRSMIEW